MQQNARDQDEAAEEEVVNLDIGEEESPYIIEPVEDPVPREAPIPEPEREEEVPT